ncbi:superoxide dismutase family protein [Roseibium salinum]|nr:superoxide dismutase family protein [Roseibium salinum]
MIAAALLSAGASVPVFSQEPAKAIARLTTSEGEPAGSVEFTDGPNGVLIEALITGHAPGEHAIHLHETGKCSPDFSAAGGHIAPEGTVHGFLSQEEPHTGDLPNIFMDVEGAGTAHFFHRGISLGGEKADLLDDDGTAVIVHEHADTYTANADPGARVACGVVEPYL